MKQIMWKKILMAGAVALAGYTAFDYYSAGLHTRPKLQNGDFSLSFKSGFRALMVDQVKLGPDRVYRGYPLEVPNWLEDAWSICKPATVEEKSQFENLEVGNRIEAICRINVDEEIVVRGYVFSRPNL